MFVLDAEHKVTHWNAAIEALTGRPREEVLGRDDHWGTFYSEKRPTMADLIVDGAGQEEFEVYYKDKFKPSSLIEGAYEAEDFFQALGEKGRWLHFTASPIRSDDGRIIGAIETLLDITERKALEENLRYYLQQVTKAQEEERRYLSRELHDDMAQILGSLSRQLDNLLRRKTKFKADDVSALQEIQSLLNTGIQSMSNFIQNLRPSLLDDLGLIPALRSLTNNLKQAAGIDIEFSVTGQERRLDNEVELLLFRIVQEALNNIGKHARATQASVTVAYAPRAMRLTISDNGRGFKLDVSTEDLPRSGKLGLMSMQERVWLLEGTLEIKSEPGQGTTLLVEVPL